MSSSSELSAAWVLASLVAAGTACSSSPSMSQPSGAAPTATAAVDPAKATFATDVVPIFASSCAAGGASCHGDTSVTSDGSQSRPFLGPATASADVQTVFDGIVGRPSAEDPSLDLVAPGDPAHSYLMLKLEGTQGTQASQCAAGELGSCGVRMPYGGVLDPGSLEIIRGWIASGARND